MTLKMDMELTSSMHGMESHLYINLFKVLIFLGVYSDLYVIKVENLYISIMKT